jgi:uncharacterized protein
LIPLYFMLWRRLFITADRRPALFWRVLGYAVLFGICLSLRGRLADVANPVLSQALPRSLLFSASEIVLVVATIAAIVGLTFVFRRFVDRRPWAGMGMPSPWRRRGDLAAGFALGAAMILIVFTVEYALGWMRIDGVKSGWGRAAIVSVLCGRFIHFIGTAVCEEIAYRGYLLQNVGERFALWIAVLTTGAVFGASHYASTGFTWAFVVGAVIASFFLAVMRLATRANWLGVGWHLGWDWLEDSLGLIPGYTALEATRSGPTLWTGTGLAIEGGLLIILVIAIALMALLVWSRRTGREIHWNGKLSPEGEILVAPAAESTPR